MIREKVYNGLDNEITLGLLIDGSEWSPAALTRVVLSLQNDDGDAATVIDSATATAGSMTWDQQATVLDNIVEVLVLKLGGESIPARDDYTGTLTLYDATFPNGKVWDDKISLEVI